MRILGIACLVACGSQSSSSLSFEFGPFPIDSGQEIVGECVQVTLNNEAPIYVNAVELSTGTGFHHSNWFWVPEYVFPGDDGTYNCADRSFNEPVAGTLGGVVFAQSTQSTHEIQSFPTGVAVKIPPHAKLVAGLHLLNASDSPLAPSLSFTLDPISEAEATTLLAGMSFENESIAIPPQATSRFTIECDLTAKHEQLFGRPPDFKIYYMLPHYHVLGAGMTIEAIRDSDGGADMVFTTSQRIGDALGGTIDPPFDMTGHGKLRFSCEYINPRDATVGWGVGDQEMCVFLAFSDSAFTWGGGAPTVDAAGPGVASNGIIDFTHDCQIFATAANE